MSDTPTSRERNTPVADALGDMLLEFLERSSQNTYKEQAGENPRLSANEIRVTTLIYRQWRRDQPCNHSYLVEQTGLSPATVSRVVTSLYEQGLIREEADPDDRRVLYLLPTEEGRRSMDQVVAWLYEWADRVTAVVLRSEQGT